MVNEIENRIFLSFWCIFMSLFLILIIPFIVLLSYGKCSTTYNVSCQPILNYYNGITKSSSIYEQKIVDDQIYYKLKIQIEYNDKVCFDYRDYSKSNTTLLNTSFYTYNTNFFEECKSAENDIKMHTKNFDTGVLLSFIILSSLIIFIIVFIIENIVLYFYNKTNKNNIIIEYTSVNPIIAVAEII